MAKKQIKKLRLGELRVLEARESGASELESYQIGYPHCKRYKPETILSQAVAFFQKPRIKHHLRKKLPTEEFIAIKNPGGRPTSYRPRYLQKMVDYFNRPAEEMVQKINEETGEISHEFVVNDLPTRAGFACELGIPSITIKNWATNVDKDGQLLNPEFAQAYILAKDYQQNILVNNTLKGHYQPSFAKFVAQNLLDWSDKKDITVTDESGPKIQINVNMTAEEAARIYLEEMKPKGT